MSLGIFIFFIFWLVISSQFKENWGLYHKTLRTRNVQQMDKFRNKLVPYIATHKHSNFDKHTSLLRNL
jgi:hypothetical protein